MATIAESTEISVTRWRPGEAPEPDSPGGPAAGEVVWCDLAYAISAEQAFARLGERCPGLEQAMLADLLTPDPLPDGRRYDGGEVRLASMATMSLHRAADGTAGELVVTPVELLAGESWLITRWHPVRAFRGSDEQPGPTETPETGELREAVARRWQRSGGRTGGDLGVLVMHELALGYAPACRQLHGWLEDWELQLYTGQVSADQLAKQREDLRELWGLRAVMRDWITPLNMPGLSLDAEKAWLPISDHEEAKRVDDRVDRVLSNLADLGATLRSSFHLLHFEEMEVERERREGVQRRIEIIAAVFLIPSFIVGFYGANTWIPGQGREWGFAVMLTAMALLTVLGVLVVLRLHRGQAA